MLKKKSLWCKSHLESFHLKLQHFANTNCRQGLADYLNLLGTCRHNVTMRHRIWWNSLTINDREGVVEYFAKEPQYYNHSELAVINQWAVEAGCASIPFPHAKPLPKDNGERFFGTYIVESKEREKYGNNLTTRRCLCPDCGSNPTPLPRSYQEETNLSLEPPDGTRFSNKPSAKKRKVIQPLVLDVNNKRMEPVPIMPQPCAYTAGTTLQQWQNIQMFQQQMQYMQQQQLMAWAIATQQPLPGPKQPPPHT